MGHSLARVTVEAGSSGAAAGSVTGLQDESPWDELECSLPGREWWAGWGWGGAS